MDKSPDLVIYLISLIVGGYSAAIAWLVTQNKNLAKRLDDTNRETIEALKASAKLGEKVPEMDRQIVQTTAENQQLRQRIADLERPR